MSEFYSLDKIISTKDLDSEEPFIYIITGNRSSGKTVAVSKLLFEDFLYKQRQFVLLSRQTNEIKGTALNFFPVIGDLFFEEYSIQINNVCDGIFKELVCFKGEEEIGVCGYVVSINGSDKVKRFSSIFKNVYNIFFDEFQSESGMYLVDEIDKFQSIMQSIFRRREGRCFLASNAVSVINPYFSAFGIDKRLMPETKILRGSGWVLEVNKNLQASQHILKSKVNKAFRNSLYTQYSSTTEFTDNSSFIEKLSGNKKFVFAILNKQKKYVLSYIQTEKLYYIEEGKSTLSYETEVSITAKEHVENSILASELSYIYTLRRMFDLGYMRFENLECKNVFFDLVRYKF